MEGLIEDEGKNGASSALDPIYVLTGCTAVGKTELALGWAEAHGAEIVSCDALLFYRGMEIGTAKPTAKDRARVPHHLIDIAEPSAAIDIARYLELAQATVRDIQARGRKALVTGGSGFYLKAFFAPVVDHVTVSPATVLAAAEWMEAGLEKAVDELARRNPQGLRSLDTFNPRRVVKALERCIETGRTLAELAADFESLTNPLVDATKRLVVLSRSKESLDARIAQRVRAMLEQGLVAEVAGLLARGLERNPSAARAIGYREVIAHLRGELACAELADCISQNTRRLAKKQRTWFRNQLPSGAKRIDLELAADPDPRSLFD